MRYMNQKNHKARMPLILIFIISLFHISPGRAEPAGELLLFPAANALYRSGLDSGSPLDKDDYEAGVNLFATLENGRFRLLAEVLLSTEEQDIERFQLGWMVGRQIFWLGRFHNPVGYWNTQYHHGSYLQTSISRPAVVEFEDASGILPAHQAGLLVEGSVTGAERNLGYALALAVGPELTHELESWEVLDPGSGDRDISTTLSVYLDSGVEDQNRVGVFLNYTEIPAHSIAADVVRQTSTGIYGKLESTRWRLFGSSFFVENSFRQASGVQDHYFFSAYLQSEIQLDDRWTLFGRLESTSGDDGDAWLDLFPEFVRDRALGGIRIDFAQQHALKLELSGNRMQGDSYRQLMLQWSAQF